MPDIGYPDFQRVVNWDSPVLYADSVDNVTTYKQSGALDVSRYAYMGGFMSITAGYCLVTLEWFLDQSMTTITGQRQFTLDQNISEICQPKIAHMGPFLQVTFEAIASNPFSGSWSLFATNRSFPLEFVPVNSLLIDQQDISVGAGVNDTFYPDSYYVGPALVGVYSNQPSGAVQFEQLSTSGTWDFFDQSGIITSNTWTRIITILPTGAWRTILENGATASASMFLVVTPTTTGST